MAPIRQQAIIWTNDDIVHRCIYVSSGLNELMPLLGIEAIYRQNANVQVVVFELMPSNNWNIAGHNQPVVLFPVDYTLLVLLSNVIWKDHLTLQHKLMLHVVPIYRVWQ